MIGYYEILPTEAKAMLEFFDSKQKFIEENRRTYYLKFFFSSSI